MKMMLIVTIVLAVFGIVLKTINNSDYYNLVQSINNNVEYQEKEEKQTQTNEQDEENAKEDVSEEE